MKGLKFRPVYDKYCIENNLKVSKRNDSKKSVNPQSSILATVHNGSLKLSQVRQSRRVISYDAAYCVLL